MRAAFGKGGAGIGAIEIREVEAPAPGPGEALVRLKAATLNFRDLLFIKGILPKMTREPEYIPLSCATGEVVEVGEGVTRVKPGDRVNPIFAQGWISGPQTTMTMLGGLVDGVAREFAAFPAESLCLVPDELGDLEAATLACAGLTAWSALFGARPLQAGEWILVQGTGGVSMAALQWAKGAGAHVIVTSSSDAKLTRAKALGADLTINYRTTPDWAQAARDLRGGAGVDIVLDVVGESQVDALAGVLNPGGMIAGIGMLESPFSWTRQTIGGHPVVPIGVGARDAHEAMLAFAAQHAIRPVVDVVYDLDRLQDALRHLESQQFFAKVGVSLI